MVIFGSGSWDNYNDVMVRVNAQELDDAIDLYQLTRPDRPLSDIQDLIPDYLRPSHSYQQATELTRIRFARKSVFILSVPVYLCAIVMARKRFRVSCILFLASVIPLLSLVILERRCRPDHTYLNDFVISENLCDPSTIVLFYEKPDLRRGAEKIALIKGRGLEDLTIQEIVRLQEQGQ
ncbi:MAG: hypothetical protein ABFD91_12550 [Anaerohalosphaeraceae bacterium]